MDYLQLISVASNKQKDKEIELQTKKVGFNTHFKSPAGTSRPENKKLAKVDEEKQKRLEKIRARVEAQSKKTPEPAKKVERFNDTIMDFTGSGLSENDVRRKKKLTQKEIERQKAEFTKKMEHLKANPIRPEELDDELMENGTGRRSSTEGKLSKGSQDKERSDSKHRSSDKNESERRKDKDKHRDRDKDGHSKHSKKDKHRDKEHKHSSKDKDHKSDKNKHKSLPKVSADIVSVPVKKPQPPPVKKKKAPSGPPPMSFADLLSVANQNKDNPNAVLRAAEPEVQKVKDKKKLKPEEPSRPMTQEEKERMERIKSKEYQRWLEQGGQRPSSTPSKSKSRPSQPTKPKSKEFIDDDDEEPERAVKKPKPKSAPTTPQYPKRAPGAIVPGSIDHKPKYQKSKSIFVPHSKEQRELALQKAGYGKSSTPQSNGHTPGTPHTTGVKLKVKQEDRTKNEMNGRAPQSSMSTSDHKSASKSKQQSTPSNSASASKNVSRNNGMSASSMSHESKKKNNQAERRPVKKEAPQSRERARPEPAMNPWDRIYGQIQKNHPKPEKKQKRANVIDSDSDYDYDDDFIDDGDDDFIDDSGAADYSKHIQEIFGYNKRKYAHIDDEDLSDMEAGFEQQMMEERRSAKIGLMEDLEDMRMEQEELKRKKMMKKKQAAKKLKSR